MRDNPGGSVYLLQKLVALLIEPSAEALVDSRETWYSVHELYLSKELEIMVARITEDPDLTLEQKKTLIKKRI